MKIKELQNLTVDELNQKKASLKQELLNLRFKVRSCTLEKPTQIKQAKKNIARIETILRERENEREKA